MKADRSLYLIVGLAFGLVFAGCHRKAGEAASANEHGHEVQDGEHHDETITFKMGKGLDVPARTAQIIGLKVEDVKEQRVASIVRLDARVYRTTAEGRLASAAPALPTTALASGQVNRSDVEMLPAGKELAVKRNNGSELKGRVKEIHEHLGIAANRAEVVLAIADVKGELEAGEMVEVNYRKETEKAAVTVSKSALLGTAEGKFVYTVSGERYVRTPVTVGAVGDESVEIRDGLYTGDQIVVYPVMTLWMAELQAIRGGQSCTDGH